MKKPIIFMFSGQGSQYYRMGEELFNSNPIFRRWIIKLDSIGAEMIGQSVLKELYGNKRKSDVFNRTLLTHPAIFMIECALTRTLQEIGIEPDCVIGTSLGEFVSAAVAGVMDVEEILECVITQAQMLERYCQRGGMLAVIHDVNLYGETQEIYENSELAAVNYCSHFVVSGDATGKISLSYPIWRI